MEPSSEEERAAGGLLRQLSTLESRPGLEGRQAELIQYRAALDLLYAYFASQADREKALEALRAEMTNPDLPHFEPIVRRALLEVVQTELAKKKLRVEQHGE